MLPKHLAICFDTNDLDGSFSIIRQIMSEQPKLGLPVLTFGFDSEIPSEKITELLKFHISKKFLEENKIKVSFLGKWYGFGADIVEGIKQLIDLTKDYDMQFLNFVINYDGQQEIVDACKIICRQVKAGKIDVENVTKENIKENTYSSYFIPPDLIIKLGTVPKLKGFLLWDSTHSRMHFTEKDVADFNTDEMKKILDKY
ncbi:undecaprenyl diphosphate synthase family protein [Candidatus Woesearchaeota archaeon]|nr:undecaprenyl diphosphate synthase family protein [Candidatus Woesearchaeota archaeon]MBW3018523.1 undecaprenyl diphosphate synthase family protein [Candidatus Woesearchaeota archaeon]